MAAIITVAIALTTVWSSEPAEASAWTVAMLVVALLLDAFIVVTRRDCVWGLVLAWASVWIYDTPAHRARAAPGPGHQPDGLVSARLPHEHHPEATVVLRLFL